MQEKKSPNIDKKNDGNENVSSLHKRQLFEESVFFPLVSSKIS